MAVKDMQGHGLAGAAHLRMVRPARRAELLWGRTASQRWTIAGRRPPPPCALKPPQSPPTYDAPRHTEARPADHLQRATPSREEVDWKRQWYPVMPIADIDAKRPTAITILGKQLVVWKDSAGDCHVFEDRCPHRLVALSEGRIEGDELMCAYHGWRFDGGGTCTKIPQLFTQDDGAKAKILKTPAACAQAFPTAASADLLWVWMSDSKHAFQEALQSPVPAEPERSTPWYSRTVPMSWEVLVENVTDPSHVPHSHHGIQGNRNAPGELEFVKTENHGVKGYRVLSKWSKSPVGPGKSRTMLDVTRLPSAASLHVQAVANPDAPEAEWEGKDLVALHFALAPVTRITSRIIFTVTSSFLPTTGLKAALIKVLNRTWRDHITRSTVLDGDAIFLHRQTIDLVNGMVAPSEYFLPARTDRPVHALWKWMHKYAPGGVELYGADEGQAEGRLDYWPRERILDRHEQHVKSCKACSGAMQNVELGVIASAAVGAFALGNVARLIISTQTLLSAQGFVSVAVVALAAFSWLKLRELLKAFGFADYIHAERD